MSLLAGSLAAVESLVGAAGGLGLAVVMAVESIFPPIPSEVVLPLAGSMVASGALSFLVAVVAATAGSVAGASVLYAVGRFGGRPAVLRLGPLLRLDEDRRSRAEAWFVRRGDLLVVVGRLVPGLRAVVSLPAGTARMPVWRFAALTALGSLIWNAGLIGVGEALAAHWAEVAAVAAPASLTLVAAAAVAVPAAWLWRRSRTAAVAR